MRAAERRAGHQAAGAQARLLAEGLGRTGTATPWPSRDPTDRAAMVRAVTAEALTGPWNATVRMLGRQRASARAVSPGLCLPTDTLLRQRGVVESFGIGGRLRLVPVVPVDGRFAAVRKGAEARHVAALEASFATRD